MVQTADPGDLAALRDAARDGRAAAMSRRRTLPPAARGDGAPSGAPAPAETVVAIDGVAAARLGRAFSMQRRRQMSQGKQALNGGVDRTPAAAGAGARAFIVYRSGAG